MIDYEQLYYDALYRIKKLEQQIKFLEDEITLLKVNSKKDFRHQLLKSIRSDIENIRKEKKDNES